jgi:hypothetical protein
VLSLRHRRRLWWLAGLLAALALVVAGVGFATTSASVSAPFSVAGPFAEVYYRPASVPAGAPPVTPLGGWFEALSDPYASQGGALLEDRAGSIAPGVVAVVYNGNGYTGGLDATVYLTDVGSLQKIFQFFNLQLEAYAYAGTGWLPVAALPGCANLGMPTEEPVLGLVDGQATLAIPSCAFTPGSYVAIAVVGGSYRVLHGRQWLDGGTASAPTSADLYVDLAPGL